MLIGQRRRKSLSWPVGIFNKLIKKLADTGNILEVSTIDEEM